MGEIFPTTVRPVRSNSPIFLSPYTGRKRWNQIFISWPVYSDKRRPWLRVERDNKNIHKHRPPTSAATLNRGHLFETIEL